jgi:ParB family chromosome partitioning protein
MITAISEPKAQRHKGTKKGRGTGGVERDLIPNPQSPIPSHTTGELATIAVDLVDPSPFQTRDESDFDAEELRQLGETIKSHGLLQPIVVRRIGERYELIAGERRLRASRLAGLATIQAKIVDVDDDQAEEMTALENLQRRDISAIAQARSYAALLRRPGATQQSVADRLGITQGQIANRIGLLKLPDEWQRRIISGEMPASAGRHLVPLCEHPEVMTKLKRQIGSRDTSDWSVDQWRNQFDAMVRQAGEDVDRTPWSAKHNCRVPQMKLSDEQVKELRIVEVEGYDDKPDRYAMNIKLAKKLLKEHEAEWEKEQDAKAAKKEAKASRNGGACPASSSKPMTVAEKKAAEAAERQRQKELAEQAAKRVEAFVIDLLRFLIVEQFRLGKWLPGTAMRMAWYLACSRPGFGTSGRLADVLEAHGIKPTKGKYGGIDDWKSIAGVEESLLGQVVRDWICSFFCSFDGEPNEAVDADDVRAIAAFMGVDFEAAWKAHQKGPWAERYWSLHTKGQLLELGKEMGTYFDDSATKASMVKRLVGQDRILPIPKELKKAAKA